MKSLILGFIVVLSLLPRICYGNMSSPDIWGSIITEPSVSDSIDIINENIHITIEDFHQARFKVTYTVKAEKEGKQVPLVFDTHADRSNRHENDFHVWTDDEEIPLLKIPSHYDDVRLLPWLDSLQTEGIRFSPAISAQGNLHYFEVDLSEGIHVITVEYTAYATVNLSGWIRKYSFTYNLEPARHWKSFGDLTIELDDSALDASFTTDLDSAHIIRENPIKVWKFNDLPQEGFEIEYKPEVSKLARFFVTIGAEGLFLIFSVILMAIHIWLIIAYRKRYPEKRFSPVMIIGVFIMPFLSFLFFMLSFTLIDWIIGDYASGRHGYTFLIFFFYPITVLVYWLLMWIVDKKAKQ